MLSVNDCFLCIYTTEWFIGRSVRQVGILFKSLDQEILIQRMNGFQKLKALEKPSSVMTHTIDDFFASQTYFLDVFPKKCAQWSIWFEQCHRSSTFWSHKHSCKFSRNIKNSQRAMKTNVIDFFHFQLFHIASTYLEKQNILIDILLYSDLLYLYILYIKLEHYL